MSQPTMFGRAETDAYIEVKKADGRVQHFWVPPSGAPMVEISADEYEKGTS